MKRILLIAIMFTVTSFVFGLQLPEYDVGSDVAKVYVKADDNAKVSLEVATVNMHTLEVSSVYVSELKVHVGAFKHKTGVVLQTIIEDCNYLYFTGINNTESRLTHYEPKTWKKPTFQFYSLKPKICFLKKDKYLFSAGGVPYNC